MAHAEENVVVMTNFLSDFNASIQFEITEPELQYMFMKLFSYFLSQLQTQTGMEPLPDLHKGITGNILLLSISDNK
ncbi:hypothetical protein [Escherichia coli]|uniref:hypothetical protein n=1 Tax=Escherichia coli TaxID=562 RepID=UPI002FCD12FB